MDPLFKINDAYTKNELPKKTFVSIKKRFPLVLDGIKRIKRASNINYPTIYVDPSLILSNSIHQHDYGIIFARTIPVSYENHIEIFVQLSAPLIMYGLKGTIHAILAHEFLHYLDLLNKLSNMKITSDEISGNAFETIYTDLTKLLTPNIVFNDHTLVSHIQKRFTPIFNDSKLENKTIGLWLNKNLPKKIINLDENTIKLPIENIIKTKFDPYLLTQIKKLEKKSHQ